MRALRLGDRFTLTDDEIDNYGEEWEGIEFIVTAVSFSTEDHPGYDDGVGGPLYDAVANIDDDSDLEWNNSVYEWEIKRI